MHASDGSNGNAFVGGSQRGSGLVLAVFVLFLLTSVGVALLFVTRTEVQSSRADVRNKSAFFLAEAGLEDGRATVWTLNRVSADPNDLSDELATVAGVDGVIDFDVDALVPTFDADGNLTGLSGYNDDVPVRGLSNLGDGNYFAFMTNDVGEPGSDPTESTTDTNDLVMLTGVGGGPDRSLEIVQAVVKRYELFPTLPATITILGPNPTFNGGKSTPKKYIGDDNGTHCPGGDPSVHKPTVGVIGAAAKASADTGVIKPLSYISDGTTGTATTADLTTDPALDPMWTDCSLLVQMAQIIDDIADVHVADCSDLTKLGTPGDEKIVVVEGDCTVSGSWTGAGAILVKGRMDFDGRASWYGPMFIIGQGDYVRSGGGNGNILGGTVVANVEGPDETLFTADDCSGDDGILSTADDGVAHSSYDVSGGGGLITGYCSAYMTNWQSARPLEILSFLQR